MHILEEYVYSSAMFRLMGVYTPPPDMTTKNFSPNKVFAEKEFLPKKNLPKKICKKIWSKQIWSKKMWSKKIWSRKNVLPKKKKLRNKKNFKKNFVKIILAK